MANETVKLKVDKSVYQQTLDQLKKQLDHLKDYRDDLSREIENLKNGDTFSGSDVKVAIEKAEKALEAADGGIKRVTGYRDSIQEMLQGTESSAAKLASDISSIDIPNMFE